MKKILTIFYLTLLLLIVTACNIFFNPDDLPEKGGLSVIIVYANEDKEMKRPEFLSDHHEHDVYEITQYTINAIGDVYPSLNIESAPYYIFLDSKGIAYETANIEDAGDFYKNNVNKRKD